MDKDIARGKGIEDKFGPAGKEELRAIKRRTDEEAFIAIGSLVKGRKQNIRRSKHHFTKEVDRKIEE